MTTPPNETTQTAARGWHALKGGDVIRFNRGWREVFDARPTGAALVTIRLIENGAVKQYGIDTRLNAEAVCRN